MMMFLMVLFMVILVRVERIFKQLELPLGFLDLSGVLFLAKLILVLHQTIFVIAQYTGLSNLPICNSRPRSWD